MTTQELINEIEGKIAKLEEPTIPLKLAVNALYRSEGIPSPYNLDPERVDHYLGRNQDDDCELIPAPPGLSYEDIQMDLFRGESVQLRGWDGYIKSDGISIIKFNSFGIPVDKHWKPTWVEETTNEWVRIHADDLPF